MSSPDEYLTPRDDNDINSSYTMADAVFSACFLNTLLRNADIVGMANFAPAVNTRGAIFTHPDGIVLRTAYHVFDMYVNLMGDTVVDSWTSGGDRYSVPGREGGVEVDTVDCVATIDSSTGAVAVACVNKHAAEAREIELKLPVTGKVRVVSLTGASPDDYNDIGRDNVRPFENNGAVVECGDGLLKLRLSAHSVNVIRIEA